jgi:hypothetical protein
VFTARYDLNIYVSLEGICWIAEARVLYQVSNVRFVVHEAAVVQFFLRVLRFSPSSSASSTPCSYQKDKRAKPGNVRQSSVVLEIRICCRSTFRQIG